MDKKPSSKPIEKTGMREVADGLSFVFNFGFLILVPLIGGLFLGLTADRKFDTKPLFTIILLLLGMIIGFVSGISQINKFTQKGKN